MFDADQLFVLWSEPAQGSRCVIGDLWREGKGGPFLFRYRSAVAGLDGFVPLPEFPNLEGVYRSAYLHGTFSQRLPSPQRPDYVSLIQGWGVQHPDDVFEVLARSGGVQMTDRIELAEFRSDEDDLVRPLEFRVAGMKHAPGSESVDPGTPLQLELEPTNPHDENATLVLTASHAKVGYVPRQYSRLFVRLLNLGSVIDASAVRRLTLPADKGRLVVRAKARASR